MEVKVWVNWENEEILTAGMLNQTAKDLAEDKEESNEDFTDWLESEEGIEAVEMLSLQWEQLKELKARWKKYCLEKAKEEIVDEYEERTIVI